MKPPQPHLQPIISLKQQQNVAGNAYSNGGNKTRVCNVLNITHCKTKELLLLYFINLESKQIHKNIYDIIYVCNMKYQSKSQEKKTDSGSIHNVNTTDIQKLTGQGNLLVSNVTKNMTQCNDFIGDHTKVQSI